MKLFVLSVLVTAIIIGQSIAITPEELEKVIKYSRDCRAKTGATIEQVTMAVAGIFVDDPNLKSQFFCISKKLGFQDDEGEIDAERLEKRISLILKNDDKTEDIMKNCAVKKSTPEETAFDAMKCFLDRAGINLLTAK